MKEDLPAAFREAYDAARQLCRTEELVFADAISADIEAIDEPVRTRRVYRSWDEAVRRTRLEITRRTFYEIISSLRNPWDIGLDLHPTNGPPTFRGVSIYFVEPLSAPGWRVIAA